MKTTSANSALTVTLDEEKPLYRFTEQIDERLKIYGTPSHGNKPDPLDELVFIILSMQTEAYGYLDAYESLRCEFGAWESVVDAPIERVEIAIRACGLARKKANYIKGSLEKILKDFGEISLKSLTLMSDADVRDYLTTLPGIGNKSASCIMMYALNRSVFPVDTHTWRISRRLGIAPGVPKPTKRQELELEAKIPPEFRYSLHVNMLSHGRQMCLTYWPKCSSCILADICPSRNKPDLVWGEWRRPSGAWANALKEPGDAINTRENVN